MKRKTYTGEQLFWRRMFWFDLIMSIIQGCLVIGIIVCLVLRHLGFPV